jgi:NAD(P)-dependent dehydrogenase (short-subunit alcohol dehydrogenase family)
MRPLERSYPNKRVLITGATTGLARALALEFARSRRMHWAHGRVPRHAGISKGSRAGPAAMVIYCTTLAASYEPGGRGFKSCRARHNSKTWH